MRANVQNLCFLTIEKAETFSWRAGRAGVNVRRNCMLELTNTIEMESPPIFKTNRVGTGHSLDKSGYLQIQC